MFRKIIFGVFIAASIVVGIYYFIYVNNLKAPVSEGINAIPPNALIIIESKQSKNVWKKISQSNLMWDELTGTKTFSELNANAKYIDSLLNQNKDVATLLENHSVFVSAHPSADNTVNLLYVYSLPNLTHQASIEDFVKTINNNTMPSSRDYAGVNISSIHPKNKHELSFAFYKGTLLMSAKETLVEDAIRQMKTGKSIALDKYFSKILSSAGKNVDANIYINYKSFPKLISRYITTDFKTETSVLPYFAYCSGWDVTVKPNAIMMNGFTQINDSLNNFLHLFAKQKPQKIEITKVIPAKTAVMYYYGVDDISTFNKEYHNYLKANHRFTTDAAYFKAFDDEYDFKMEEEMLHWMQNEMAVVITQPSSSDFTNNTYAVIKSTDAEDAVAYLNKTIKTIIADVKHKPDTTHFKNHIIAKLDLPELLSHLLGLQFAQVKSNYFTSINDYLVFGNSDEALRNYINDFEFGKTLAKDKSYLSFADNIPNETNVYLYTSLARSINIYSSLANEDVAKELDIKKEMVRKFEAAGIQFAANNKSVYSSAYLKYNPEQKQETGTLWETKLDTTISSKPYLLINHNTNGKDVFVQDDNNKIYLISNKGKILWTKQLDEKIMGDVVQLDALKTNKLQLLFNTHNAIYMFDRNGNIMNGFPVKLKSAATCGITLVDYDNNKDYRIFVATENKKIISFKANGDAVTGFKFDKTSNTVFLPIQHFKINGKDNLCAVDAKGRIYIVDRHGESHIKMKEHFAQGITNFFIEAGKDNASTYISAADTLGTIMKLSFAGKKEMIKLSEFETSPYYDFQDLNNDNTNEHIFLTRNDLKVYSSDKTLLYHNHFKNTITQTPQYFLFPDLVGKIGVVSESENKIYLFNDNGSLYNNFPLSGKTLFSIGDLNNDGSLNIVVGSADNSIYVYQIEY
jgi:hypothetical protein